MVFIPMYNCENQITRVLKQFDKNISKYIDETVSPDFHRAVRSFLNYDAVRKQLVSGSSPRITFKKVNGEPVILTAYKLNDEDDRVNETLWVFAKD